MAYARQNNPTELPQSNSGCYLLVMRLENDVAIRAGGLGRVELRSGVYIYAGRAKRYLRQRLARHIRGDGKTHWHIDHLRRVAEVSQVFVSPALDECAIASALAEAPGAEVIRRFGASDCRCEGHLVRVSSLPQINIELHEVDPASLPESL
jgi:sugar fermentation stimulation protein A